MSQLLPDFGEGSLLMEKYLQWLKLAMFDEEYSYW